MFWSTSVPNFMLVDKCAQYHPNCSLSSSTMTLGQEFATSPESFSTVICFSPDDNVRNSIPSIVIDGNLVESAEYTKLLDGTLSNDLTWNRHVECIEKDAAKKCVLRRLG